MRPPAPTLASTRGGWMSELNMSLLLWVNFAWTWIWNAVIWTACMYTIFTQHQPTPQPACWAQPVFVGHLPCDPQGMVQLWKTYLTSLMVSSLFCEVEKTMLTSSRHCQKIKSLEKALPQLRARRQPEKEAGEDMMAKSCLLLTFFSFSSPLEGLSMRWAWPALQLTYLFFSMSSGNTKSTGFWGLNVKLLWCRWRGLLLPPASSLSLTSNCCLILLTVCHHTQYLKNCWGMPSCLNVQMVYNQMLGPIKSPLWHLLCVLVMAEVRILTVAKPKPITSGTCICRKGGIEKLSDLPQAT